MSSRLLEPHQVAHAVRAVCGLIAIRSARRRRNSRWSGRWRVYGHGRGIGFPHARQVIQITRDRVAVATGERSREIVYAICSIAFEHAHPHVIAAWLRDHWSIENDVHWVRDVTFEDRSTGHCQLEVVWTFC
jgi:hypothetical protein